MRFLITLTLVSIACFALGQNNTTGGSKISDAEKKRLEKEFKVLGNFYIDDSGVVVYQNQPEDKDKEEESSNNDNQPRTPPKPTERTSQKEEPPVVDQRKSRVEGEKTVTPTVGSKTTISSNNSYYKKEIVEQDVKTTPTKDTKKEPVVIPKEIEPIVVSNKKDEKSVSPKIDNAVAPKEKTKGKNVSIFNKKRESQYKTMEEAALAVDALLDELKKEEGQTTNSGSMSSKLSRGVNKNLRKKSGSSNAYGETKPNYTTNVSVSEDDSSKFGVEPSYFINGVQVEKVEISKLRKKDILRREIRVRNTVTGNPNGEVWYDVK